MKRIRLFSVILLLVVSVYSFGNLSIKKDYKSGAGSVKIVEAEDDIPRINSITIG